MNYRLVFNLAVSIVAAFVIAVLMFITIFSNVEKRRTAYYFLWALAAGFIASSLMIGYYATRLSENCPLVVVKIIATLIHISMFGASHTFMLYCLTFFGSSKKISRVLRTITFIIGIGFSLSIIVNAFNGMFFDFVMDNGIAIKTTNIGFIPYTYVGLLYVVEIFVLIFQKGIRRSERIAFLTFIMAPLVALVFHIIYPELSIYTFSYIASFLSHFLYFYVQRGLMIQKQEKELSEKQIELTISQIRPHFIYNCLSSISYLCTKDPQLAVEAIDDFSSFLRVNFSNISQNKIVPFTQELEHTMKYLKLEKMRFEERVRVYFDIRANDFKIPSLTLQPLVENAVKHGVCKKAEGGTIIIRSTETDKEFVVEVIDDGIGFDPDVPPDDGRVHVGLTNVENRLKSMVNGRLQISSKINKGTRMTIHIPKGA